MQRTLFTGAALIAFMNSVNAVQIQVEANPPHDDSMYAQLNADKLSNDCQTTVKMFGKMDLTGKCKREVEAEEAAAEAAKPASERRKWKQVSYYVN